MTTKPAKTPARPGVRVYVKRPQRPTPTTRASPAPKGNPAPGASALRAPRLSIQTRSFPVPAVPSMSRSASRTKRAGSPVGLVTSAAALRGASVWSRSERIPIPGTSSVMAMPEGMAWKISMSPARIPAARSTVSTRSGSPGTLTSSSESRSLEYPACFRNGSKRTSATSTSGRASRANGPFSRANTVPCAARLARSPSERSNTPESKSACCTSTAAMSTSRPTWKIQPPQSAGAKRVSSSPRPRKPCSERNARGSAPPGGSRTAEGGSSPRRMARMRARFPQVQASVLAKRSATVTRKGQEVNGRSSPMATAQAGAAGPCGCIQGAQAPTPVHTARKPMTESARRGERRNETIRDKIGPLWPSPTSRRWRPWAPGLPCRCREASPSRSPACWHGPPSASSRRPGSCSR